MTTERIDVLAVMDADIEARETTLAHLESLHGEDARPVCARISRERIAAAKQARAAVAELIEALDHIGGLTRALRVGGPDPMDLDDMSDALRDATDTAHAALARVGAP